MSLPAVPGVRHALKQAHQILCDQIERAKHEWSSARFDLRDAADHFFRCFCDTRPDASHELERRASLVKSLTAGGSDYAAAKEAAAAICRKLNAKRRPPQSWAVGKALEIDLQNALGRDDAAWHVEEVQNELRGAEQFRRHLESTGKSTDEVRGALETFERECRNIVQLGRDVAADGCYQLWHLHSAIGGADSSESRLVRAWLESSDLESIWLDEIAAAAESMMAWIEDVRPAKSPPRPKSLRSRPGRRPDTDEEKDKRVFDAWRTGHYQTYQALADELGEMKRDVHLAIDRHRKRIRKQR